MDQIIELEQTYLRVCAELYVTVFNGQPWNDQWKLETAYKRLNDIYHAPDFKGLLYLSDGHVKGAIFGNFEQYYCGLHYYLKEMFVVEELQGKGIGSSLMKHLEVVCREHEAMTIYLFTSKGNLTSRFYQKNGYQEYESMAMMGKDISEIKGTMEEVSETRLKKGGSEATNNRLEKFENVVKDLVAKQKKLADELEKLRAEDKAHSVKFKQLLADKMVTSNILILLKSYGL